DLIDEESEDEAEGEESEIEEIADDEIADDEDDEDEDEDEDDDDDEDDERAQTLDLVAGRLVPDLHNALIGLNAGDRTEVTTVLADDHPNESARGKTVTFKVKVKGIQERILPDWEELPALENFEGDLDELRIKTRTNMEQSVQNAAERKVIDTYIEELLTITEFDIPDVMVRELADEMLHEQGHQFERYGITLDQMLQYRGQTHDQAVDALMPDAERQTKTTLALQKLVEQEGLNVTVEDIQAEILHLAMDYDEATRESVIERLRTEMISQVANMVIDRKLRARIVEIATGVASALEAPVVTDETPAAEVPAETPAAEASVEEKPAEE
ncbi:MAG: trigger factor, partial [Oscillochloris sp.]|nr:trigger factor [Oscillochloris sp.]